MQSQFYYILVILEYPNREVSIKGKSNDYEFKYVFCCCILFPNVHIKPISSNSVPGQRLVSVKNRRQKLRHNGQKKTPFASHAHFALHIWSKLPLVVQKSIILPSPKDSSKSVSLSVCLVSKHASSIHKVIIWSSQDTIIGCQTGIG